MLRGIGPTELIILIFAFFILVLPFILWVYVLVDALKLPSSNWDVAGENRTLWIVLIVVLGLLGALLYWLLPRPKVKDLQRK